MWRANAGSRQAMSRTATAARSFVVPSNSACAASACARHNAPPATAPASTIGPRSVLAAAKPEQRPRRRPTARRARRRRSGSASGRRLRRTRRARRSPAPRRRVRRGNTRRASTPPAQPPPSNGCPSVRRRARRGRRPGSSVPVDSIRALRQGCHLRRLRGASITVWTAGPIVATMAARTVTRPAGRFRANVVGRSRRGRRRARTLTRLSTRTPNAAISDQGTSMIANTFVLRAIAVQSRRPAMTPAGQPISSAASPRKKPCQLITPLAWRGRNPSARRIARSPRRRREVTNSVWNTESVPMKAVNPAR